MYLPYVTILCGVLLAMRAFIAIMSGVILSGVIDLSLSVFFILLFARQMKRK